MEYTRYLSLDTAYQTLGVCDIELAPVGVIIDTLQKYHTIDRQSWLDLMRTTIRVRRLDVVRCIPIGTKIRDTTPIQRTAYINAALRNILKDVPKGVPILVEDHPDIPGSSAKINGAFYTLLTHAEMDGRRCILVPSSLKNSLEFLIGKRDFTKYLKSIRPSITSHEAIKEFSKINIKCIALIMHNTEMLKGVGQSAHIPAANLDDAADAFLQALSYHLTYNILDGTNK